MIAISQAKQTDSGMPSHHGLADGLDGVDHRPGRPDLLVGKMCRGPVDLECPGSQADERHG